MAFNYGQIHVVVDKASESDFDQLYFGNTDSEILGKVKKDFVERIVESNYGNTGEEAEGTLESLFHLLQVKSADEMKTWFEQYYSYYTFDLFTEEN